MAQTYAEIFADPTLTDYDRRCILDGIEGSLDRELESALRDGDEDRAESLRAAQRELLAAYPGHHASHMAGKAL